MTTSNRAYAFVPLLLLVVVLVPAAAGQIPGGQSELLTFQMEPAEGLILVSKSPGGMHDQIATFLVTIRDVSFDRAPPAGAGQDEGQTQHFYLADVRWAGSQPSGWSFSAPDPTAFVLASGQEQLIEVQLKPQIAAESIYAAIVLNVTMRDLVTGDRFVTSQETTLVAKLAPEPGVFVQVKGSEAPSQVRPGEIVRVPFIVRNTDLYPNRIRVTAAFEEGVDSQALGMAGMGVFHLRPLEEREVNITFVAPQDEFWYISEGLLFSVTGAVEGQEGISYTAGYAVIVNGFNWQPSMFILILILLIIIVLFILFLVIAKRHVAERILGKPLPPWKVPKEAAHLDVLRREDPKRFYILRYFLMEEEYESSLNWFYAYKKRTKRSRRHESKATKYQDKAAELDDFTGGKYDRRARMWVKYYAWRKARRQRWAERKVAKYQNRLDKRHEKDFEKDHEKWEKKVEKLTLKANKPILRERKKWEKEKAKKLDKWESEVAKLQEAYEKDLEKAEKEYEKAVKKGDKDAWKGWREAVADAESENKVRKAEGREPMPIPQLKSDVVEEPDWPKKPELPPKPRVGKEPVLEKPEELPAEPTLEKPALEDSKYAKKARRKHKKAARKIKKFDKRLAAKLAKGERKRAKKAVKVERKRRDFLDKAEDAYRPSLVERVFRLTPEARDRRARKKLVKSLVQDEAQHFAESEESQLDRIRANARRQEAQKEAELIRTQAQVRKASAVAGKDVDAKAADRIERMEKELTELKASNKQRISKAEQESKQRIQNESQRLRAELEQPDKAARTATGGK